MAAAGVGLLPLPLAQPPQGAIIPGINIAGVAALPQPVPQEGGETGSISQALQEEAIAMPTTITSHAVYQKCIFPKKSFKDYLRVGESRVETGQRPAQGRQEVQAPAVALAVAPLVDTALKAKNRLRALNGGTQGEFPAGRLPDRWTQNQINQIMGEANRSIPDNIKNANPFIQADYDDAMIAWLNTPANQGGLPLALFRR